MLSSTDNYENPTQTGGLNGRLPVRRGKRNVPEIRCGLHKLDGYPRRPNLCFLHRDHPALQVFAGIEILQRSFCQGATRSVSAISAPCALTTNVSVLS